MIGKEKIAHLLAGTYIDPDSGKNVEVTTRHVAVSALGFGRKVAVVSDAATHDILGRRAERALDGRFDVQSVVLPAAPHLPYELLADDEEPGTSCWTEFLGKRIARILLPTAYLTRVLTAAGADLTPQAIHLSRDFYESALLRCREIRDRYTFLDLASNAGHLQGLIGKL